MDEVDAHPSEPWSYEVLMPYLDAKPFRIGWRARQLMDVSDVARELINSYVTLEVNT